MHTYSERLGGLQAAAVHLQDPRHSQDYGLRGVRAVADGSLLWQACAGECDIFVLFDVLDLKVLCESLMGYFCACYGMGGKGIALYEECCDEFLDVASHHTINSLTHLLTHSLTHYHLF